MDGIQFFLHGAVQGHCAGIRLVTQKQQQVQQRYLVFVQVGQISQVVVFGGIQGVYGGGQFVIQTGCLRQLTRVQGVGQHIAADGFGVGQPHGVVHLGIGFQGIHFPTQGAFCLLSVFTGSVQLILGTETFCRDAWRFWEQVQDNPRLLGDFVWSGMDYLGEVGLGAWEYKDYAPDFAHGPGWISSGCGRVDLIGTPLGEALYTRVVFEQQAGPLMAVVPVNHTRDSHSPSAWKMSNALPSWSWQGQEGAPATVEVYSRGDTVELLLNDEPVARRKVSRTLCTVFHITYHPGTLTAVARDAQGRELGRHSLRSAGDETCLCLLPEQPAPPPGRAMVFAPAVHRRPGHPQAAGAGHRAGDGAGRHPGGTGQRLPLPPPRLPHRGDRYLLRRSAGRGAGRRGSPRHGDRPGRPPYHGGVGPAGGMSAAKIANKNPVSRTCVTIRRAPQRL